MEKAYMIRNDGERFPVVQHPYGNVDEVTETLFAAEWLYGHTRHDAVKEKVIRLVADYAVFYEGLSNSETLMPDLKAVISGYPYKYLSAGFVEDHAAEISEAFSSALESGGKAEMQRLMKDVVAELNQEFLRARYGGLYNTRGGSREMVFRVSSAGFDWYPIIWEFVYDDKRSIDSVTIVRDEESTGVRDGFYRAQDGRLYDRYPVDDFLMEKGKPVVETKDPVLKLLMSGAPLCEMASLPMNRERIEYRYRALVQRDDRRRSFFLD